MSELVHESSKDGRQPEPYIRPRKKLDGETEQQTLAHRLEEYIEYAYATKRFADVGFYEELLRFVESVSDDCIQARRP